MLPEPFATLGVAALGEVGMGWRELKKRRVKNWAERVKLGALITAKTVDKLVRPVTNVMNDFKAEQVKESRKTNAIMPDQIAMTKAA